MPVAIKVEKVTKNFGRKKALDGVSFEVAQGSIFGFLGPNGAGKTTTIRCLMNYISASHGQISILGGDSQRQSAELKSSIGYLSSDIQLNPHWTAGTHIEFLAGIKGRGRTSQLVKLFDLDLKTKVSKLSSGNKQKLAIILAFLGDPKVLIMDEPTRALDPLLQNQLYTLLREFATSGGTVFLSSHNLAEVQQLCDQVAVIRDGRVVAAETMQDILQTKIHYVQAIATEAIGRVELEKLAGVEIIDGKGKSISLKVRGSIDPVISALAKHSLTDLEVTHANLEDIFMEYY
jgi:ABC-2 type transport system ATP-binding protein